MNKFVASWKHEVASPARRVPRVARANASNQPIPSVRCLPGIFQACCLALAATLIVGCGDGKPGPLKVYPVTGTIKFQGRPAAGAAITLFPKDSSIPEEIRPNAIADETGHFDLGTYGDVDGAPEGDYAVAVTWRPLVQSNGSASPGPNVLPARYALPETSQLTVTVGDDETELKPIELAP